MFGFRLGEIVILLKIEPIGALLVEVAAKAERHVRIHAGLPAQNRGNPLAGHMQRFGQSGAAHPEIIEIDFLQDDAWMFGTASHVGPFSSLVAPETLARLWPCVDQGPLLVGGSKARASSSFSRVPVPPILRARVMM